jgi:hypothetical protein
LPVFGFRMHGAPAFWLELPISGQIVLGASSGRVPPNQGMRSFCCNLIGLTRCTQRLFFFYIR